MSTLILCGLTEEENEKFLEAERALLAELPEQKGWGAEYQTHTLRLKELPDPSETEKIHNLGLELLNAFGLETQEFQTEFLTKNGFAFLAIHSREEKPVEAAAAFPAMAKPKRAIPRLLWQVPAVGAGALVFLVVLYYGIGLLLTRQAEARYSERDCISLVKLAGSLEKAYPMRIAPFTDPARKQAEECRTYLNAESLYVQKKWEQSYLAYREYEKTYSGGIYAKEAQELSADSLFEWASAQRGKQDYSNAVDNLTLLLNEYGGTSSAPRAEAALPETYLEWGQKCRAESEFSEAETIYLSLNQWADQTQRQPLGKRARAELAQTYFDWGKDLQTKKDFTTASSRFDKAISIDPDAGTATGVAAQTRAYLPGFQRAWGEYLISQGKFPEAIEHFKTSISLSSPENKEHAQNVLTQAYLQWAETLRKKEDFNQALDKIEIASGTAVTDDSRKNVEEAHSTTIDQFSRSKGTQAQKIITDAVKSICQSGKAIEAPPIIGILDEKRLTVSGVSLTLPGDVSAQAPGNLYFVACAAEKEVTVQTCPYSRTGFGSVTHWIKRIRYDWQIKVFRSQSGTLFKERTFQGSSPESCPYIHSFSSGSSTHYHYGDKPKSATVADWLASLLK